MRIERGTYVEYITTDKEDKPTYIYFILDPNTKLLKIGFTSDPKDRPRMWLQGSNRKLLGLIEGTWEDEQRFHKALAVWRREGEWFEWNAETQAFVESFGPLLQLGINGSIIDNGSIRVEYVYDPHTRITTYVSEDRSPSLQDLLQT